MKPLVIFLFLFFSFSIAHAVYSPMASDVSGWDIKYTNNIYDLHFKRNVDDEGVDILVQKLDSPDYFVFSFITIQRFPDFRWTSGAFTNSLVRYGLYDYSSVRYTILDEGIKQEIIIHREDIELPLRNRVVLRYKLNPADTLTIVGDEGEWNMNNDKVYNSFTLMSGDSVMFSFPQPHIFDSNGNEIYSYYILKRAGVNIFIEIPIETDWLNNAAYPIVIDPTFYSEGSVNPNPDPENPNPESPVISYNYGSGSSGPYGIQCTTDYDCPEQHSCDVTEKICRYIPMVNMDSNTSSTILTLLAISLIDDVIIILIIGGSAFMYWLTKKKRK